jgi:integrase
VADNKTQRRQRHGSAWYWNQTDSWYYTAKGTKRRVPLLDDRGKRIRGHDNKQAAQLAFARVRLKGGLKPMAEALVTEPTQSIMWSVARVCSEYIEHCRHAVAAGRMHPEHRKDVDRYLNELCGYCGALDVTELKRGYVSGWVESQPSWRSPVTRGNVIAIVLAAFNHVQNEHGVRNPLRGLKKPPARPRLQSISPEDEQTLYRSTNKALRDFIFAAIHTGLRPFCELAKLTADQIEETPRGMMWRVYSSKTKKIRKIPVRPKVAVLTRKLVKSAPRGSGIPVFRNPQGRPWKKPTAGGYLRAVKRKLGWDIDRARRQYSCYTCRHTFAHRMLSGYWNDGAGCSIEVLAELMGNTPKTAFDHYGKEWGQHYQEPLWTAMVNGRMTSTNAQPKTSRAKSR